MSAHSFIFVVAFSALYVGSGATRMTSSRMTSRLEEGAKRVKARPEDNLVAELQERWPAVLEGTMSRSLLERAHNSTAIAIGSKEPLTVSAVVGIVFAIISIVTTAWDLWEKWNAIIMLKYALSEMKTSKWSRLEKYKKYSEISFCMRDRVNEAVDTMQVVATYFKILHYAETQCSRPDVHLDWFSTSKRCTRDFATERVAEMHTDICSAQYAEGLFSTVEMLSDDSMVKPPMEGCACLPDHLCGRKSWCYVAADSSCPDVDSNIMGLFWSSMPCKVKGMADADKARSLMKATCTVCNHGFFRNAGLIEVDFYSGTLDPSFKGRDIRDEMIRDAVKLRYQNSTAASDLQTPDLKIIEDDEDISVEEKTYLEVVKWERLMAFDKKCNDFKATLPTSERTQLTGEDLVNEKIARLAVDGRLGKLGQDMEWGAEAVQKVAQTGANAFRSAEVANDPRGKITSSNDAANRHPQKDSTGPKPNTGAEAKSPGSLLESSELVEDLNRVRGSIKRLTKPKGPNLDHCSDYKMLDQDEKQLVSLAAKTTETMSAADCARVEGAVVRKSAWRRSGIGCKCQAYGTHVYCGERIVVGRTWKLADVAQQNCTTNLYCSKFPKTQIQVRFLAKARLGCSVVPGAEDSSVASAPHCKCSKEDHMLFCGTINYGRGNTFNLFDDVLNMYECQDTARCAEPEDLSHLEAANNINKRHGHCSPVRRARPIGKFYDGWLGSKDCGCKHGRNVYCGANVVREEREFNRLSLLREGCSEDLYCGRKAKSHAQVIAERRTVAHPKAPSVDQRSAVEKVSVKNSGLLQLRSSTDRILDALLWIPVQVARIFSVTTQGLTDWGQAIWWFAFNNIYGAFGVVEAYGLLAKAAVFADKFVQWTGIITFFIWLINDAIFIGLNSDMCPKISDWIEIMDGVRAEDGLQANQGDQSPVARDLDVFAAKTRWANQTTKPKRQWCDTKLVDVGTQLQAELLERILILRNMFQFQKDAVLNMPTGLNDPTEVLDTFQTDQEELEKQVADLALTDGSQPVSLELSKTHEKVTRLLKERLQPKALCPVAEQVMRFKWRGIKKLSEVHQRRLESIACRCDPRPAECGEVEDHEGKEKKIERGKKRRRKRKSKKGKRASVRK